MRIVYETETDSNAEQKKNGRKTWPKTKQKKKKTKKISACLLCISFVVFHLYCSNSFPFYGSLKYIDLRQNHSKN